MAQDPPIRIAVLPVTPFQQNCALVWCAKTMKGAFVDPGGEVDRLLAAAQETGVTVEKVLLTHGHLDHAGGAAEIAERLGVPIEGPQADEIFWLERIEADGARYGLQGGRNCTPDRWFEDGDVATVGEAKFDVVHCPGHTPGHVVFINKDVRFAFVGDVLFKGSIGRTDFPKGNHDQLISSIRDKLFPLGDDIQFLPGHGELSTFGWERKTNPFVSDLAVGAG